LAELPAAASWLLAQAGEHRIFLFEGSMGAGKTTFIKEICAALGVRENVTSPTFALVNEYEDGENRPVYHFDFYRIADEKEALAIGALEYFDSGDVCLIEWPSKIRNLLPEHYLLVEMTEGDGEARTITLKSY
jgi:tRNA threonylcarbamoyladenosine biosynthesis protein TsaE